MRNSRDIGQLRSDVAANCRIFLTRCKAAGLNVLVTGTVRDQEQQDVYYEKGTGRKTVSFHKEGVGLAFDICKNVKGEEYSDLDFFKKCAVIGEEMGFTWGGRWKSRVDMPHFQWDDGGKYSDADVIAGRYPPPMPLWEEEKPMTVEEAKAIVKEKAGLEPVTIEFLYHYRYGDELLLKLAKAML
jgi:peptidoglycan L-alanyl-D-glutamate endopeptidase CwlK